MGKIWKVCKVMPVVVILLLLGGYEAFWGFLQLYGFSVSNHSLYALTGSFYNPGPYMGYLAMVLPVIYYIIMYSSVPFLFQFEKYALQHNLIISEL